MIRTYVRIARVILLAVAAAGLVIFGWEGISIFYHAGVGLLFLYVGFSRLEAVTVRQMVGGHLPGVGDLEYPGRQVPERRPKLLTLPAAEECRREPPARTFLLEPILRPHRAWCRPGLSRHLAAENRHHDGDDDRQEEKNHEEQTSLQSGGGYECARKHVTSDLSEARQRGQRLNG